VVVHLRALNADRRLLQTLPDAYRWGPVAPGWREGMVALTIAHDFDELDDALAARPDLAQAPSLDELAEQLWGDRGYRGPHVVPSNPGRAAASAVHSSVSTAGIWAHHAPCGGCGHCVSVTCSASLARGVRSKGWAHAQAEKAWLPESPAANLRYPVAEWWARIGSLMPQWTRSLVVAAACPPAGAACRGGGWNLC
jgi:hypothetical protein